MSQSIATPQAITVAEARRRADLSALTFTTTGLNANGQQINDVGVYDKQ